MNEHLLMKGLQPGTKLYLALQGYLQKHPAEYHDVVKMLIYFSLDTSNTYCTAFATHLKELLIYLKNNNSEQFRSLNDRINAEDKYIGGNFLINSLFSQGALHAIYEYIRILPISLLYQNCQGDTILHQLSYACKNIFNHAYNGFDDEIENGSDTLYEMEYARDILGYLIKNENLFKTLTQKSQYAINNKEETALLIFLKRYNYSINMKSLENVDIAFLNDLLIASPKSLIMSTYKSLCEDNTSFSNQFSKEMMKEVLLSSNTIIQRYHFHHEKPGEQIFESDFDHFELGPFFLERENYPHEGIDRQEFLNNHRNDMVIDLDSKIPFKKSLLPYYNHGIQRMHSWTDEQNTRVTCSSHTKSAPHVSFHRDNMLSPTPKKRY